MKIEPLNIIMLGSDRLMINKINELVAAHNSQVKDDACSSCQEVAVLRAQVKSMGEALEKINKLSQGSIYANDREHIAEISLKALAAWQGKE